MTVEERFWRKVDRSWVRPETPDACWLWIGKPSNRGYGQLTTSGRSTVTAHRLSYELHKGSIPAGHEVDHLCRVRLCVNPAHLEAVSHAENLRRGTGFAAVNAAKTHCPHGHAYTPENTYLNPHPDGGRICRTCKRERDRLYRRKHKEGVG